MSVTKGYPVRLKPRSPSQLRDVPCGRAPAGLFDIPPRPARGARLRARQLQVAMAQAVCRGVPGRPGCPFRLECLAWALQAREIGVYGGVEVTSTILRNEQSRREMMDRATEEAAAPANQRGKLAERSGQAGGGEPARPQAEGPARVS